MPETIYTVGHSNLEAEAFFTLLTETGICTLAAERAFFPSARARS